jgi:hypothetical protein
MTRPALHDLATLAGAMPVGSQWLFSLDDLARLVRLAGGDMGLLELHDRLQEKGVNVTLLC